MKVLLVGRRDAGGGAARAVSRLHDALRAKGYASSLLVATKYSKDPTVLGPKTPLAKAWSLLRPALANRLMRLRRTPNPNWHSCAAFLSGLADQINHADADIVNLHWIGEETLSVEEVGAITKPVVWTMHDMWPFCGAEHSTSDGPTERWRVGYTKANVPEGYRGFDIDQWTWQRKRRCWRPMQLIAPSRWLAECALQSALMSSWPVEVIPNVLDTARFRPRSKISAREEFGLPQDAQLLLFGSCDKLDAPLKGWDLLLSALAELEESHPQLGCIMLGHPEPKRAPKTRLKLSWLGRIDNDETLARVYAAADVVIVPSRQESLSQMAAEAQACGCPVVAFDATGLRDVVEHFVTGYLAKSFDTNDLAAGIRWVIDNEQRRLTLCNNARKRAERLWATEVVIPRYVSIFERVIENYRKS